jgi:hypothetical protein
VLDDWQASAWRAESVGKMLAIATPRSSPLRHLLSATPPLMGERPAPLPRPRPRSWPASSIDRDQEPPSMSPDNMCAINRKVRQQLQELRPPAPP